MEANQGNPEALVKFINQIVSSEGITVADCTLKEGRLNLILEGLDIPSQERTVKLISKALKNFKLPDTTTVYIEGRKFGSNAPHWGHEVELVHSENKELKQNIQQKARKKSKNLVPKTNQKRTNRSSLIWLTGVLVVLSGVFITIQANPSLLNPVRQLFLSEEDTGSDQSLQDLLSEKDTSHLNEKLSEIDKEVSDMVSEKEAKKQHKGSYTGSMTCKEHGAYIQRLWREERDEEYFAEAERYERKCPAESYRDAKKALEALKKLGY